MKTLMSLAIAAVLTLSVMPVMVDVSAQTQEPAVQNVEEYLARLSEIVRDIESTVGQASDFDIDVRVDLEFGPLGRITGGAGVITCFDSPFCSLLVSILEFLGFTCIEISDVFICSQSFIIGLQ
jgi:hypothetical protein